jgi:hypothetical protein
MTQKWTNYRKSFFSNFVVDYGPVVDYRDLVDYDYAWKTQYMETKAKSIFRKHIFAHF